MAAGLSETILAFCSIDMFSFSAELFVIGTGSDIALLPEDVVIKFVVAASASAFCAEVTVCDGTDFMRLEKFAPAPAVIAATEHGFDTGDEFSLGVLPSASLPVCMGCDATNAGNPVLLRIFTELSVGRLGSWAIAAVWFCEEGFPLLFPLSFVPVVPRPLFPDLLVTLGVDDASCVSAVA